MTLGPLPLADAAALVDGPRSSDEIARLHDACGGNPFLLQQLARSQLLPAPLASTASTQSAIGALLQTELAPLSSAARLLLDGAAVAGDPFEVGLARTAAGIDDEATALAALDELLAAHLVRPTDQPRSFAFRTRSCAAASTRAPVPAGASPRTAAPPMRCAPAVPGRPHSPTTCATAPSPVIPRRSRSSRPPASRSAREHQRARWSG